MTLTTGQWFAILPKIGGSISIIASSLVTRDILKKRKRHGTIPLTSAITLAKCMVCLVFSFVGPLLSTWMAPRGEAYFALGTTTTCEAQGFIATFCIVSFVTYFVALVAIHGLKSRQLRTDVMNDEKFRKAVLSIPLILALVAATIPLINDSYNFSGIYSCSIAPYPLGCEKDLTCTRGFYARRTVGFITFSFNAVAYLCAFLGFYTEAKPPERYHSDRCPTFTLTLTICLGFMAGSFFIMTHGSESAKLVPFYMSVILTPLTGFFMALIYFCSSNPLHGNHYRTLPLVEPLLKSVDSIYAEEATTDILV